MSRPVIFLDDGGVMNDNALRRPQWQRLLGEYMPGVLGGKPEMWSEANRVVAGRMFEAEAWAARMATTNATDYADFDRAWRREWIEGVCQIVGVETPSEDEGHDITCRAYAYVTRRVRASFPGAIEAIRALRASGYTLHTASGEPSSDLTGYLAGMGVDACFGRLYGADLISTLKNGPVYYERLLADAAVSPGDALIVDDSPHALSWAHEVGARGVLVGAALTSDDEDMPWIASLAELPAYLETL